MNPTFKIGILGIGGVGGYLAHKLITKYKDSDKVEVVLITREHTKEIIDASGLKLITPESEEVVYPNKVVSEAGTIGKLDLIIICVKSYDIEASITLLNPCIGENTIILPFLNGVDITERIQKLLPETKVLHGCVYIVSRLIEPGVVKLLANIIRFYLGGDVDENKLSLINNYFTEAGINSEVSEQIIETIWEKFIFISPFATLTSYLNKPIGDIIGDPVHKAEMLQLITEVNEIAIAKRIHLKEDMVQYTFEKMKKVPYETTSSMHADFEKGKKTELDSLCAYVVEQGKLFNVPTPTYERMLMFLVEKSTNQLIL